MNRVGAVAEAEGHHPDIALAWGRVDVKTYTHKIDGLTESDFILALKSTRNFSANLKRSIVRCRSGTLAPTSSSRASARSRALISSTASAERSAYIITLDADPATAQGAAEALAECHGDRATARRT